MSLHSHREDGARETHSPKGLLGWEEPLQHYGGEAVAWVVSWVPTPVRAIIAESVEWTLRSLAALAQDLPPSHTLPCAWEVSHYDPKTYWAAHLTRVIEEDILDAPDLPIETLQGILETFEACIGERTLSPWVFDRGLQALQRCWQNEKKKTAFLSLITQYRCDLRNQLLQHPEKTLCFLMADLNQQLSGGLLQTQRWTDVVHTAMDYRRVLPPHTSQCVLHALGEHLTKWREQGDMSLKQYARGKKVLKLARRKLQRTRPYQLLEIAWTHDHTLAVSSSWLSFLFSNMSLLGRGITLALMTQAFFPAISQNTPSCESNDFNDFAVTQGSGVLPFIALSCGTSVTSLWAAIPSLELSFHTPVQPFSLYTVLWRSLPLWLISLHPVLGHAGCEMPYPSNEVVLNISTSESDVSFLRDGGWVVVWVSENEGSSKIQVYGQRYRNNGTAWGSEFRVNTYSEENQGRPIVAALSDGGWVIVWESWEQDGWGYGVYGQRYAENGVASGSEFQVNTYTESDQSDPDATGLLDGGWVVVWQSNGQDGSGFGVYGRSYAADGTPLGKEFQANTYAKGEQSYPAVTVLLDGGWVVTWRSNGQDGSGYGVYGQRYTKNGTIGGGEFQVNRYTYSYQLDPAITLLRDGGWVIVWQSDAQDNSGYGVYGQRYSAEGSALGKEFQVNTYTSSNQIAPAISALRDGGWVVVWLSDCDVRGQRFNAEGNPILTTTDVSGHLLEEFTIQNKQGITCSYFLSLTANQAGDQWLVLSVRESIILSLYAVDGSLVDYRPPSAFADSEFQANTYTAGDQSMPAVASLADGGWAVVWESLGQDGSAWGVYGRRYTGEAEFQVNAYTDNDQILPDIAALQDGGWVVVWQSASEDGSWFGVYGQRYAANGSPRGKEFQINTYVEHHQEAAAVAGLRDGGWVVVWESEGDGSGYGIYGQRYFENGSASGKEFQVNTYTNSDQFEAAVAALLDGGWLVMWSSDGQDGSLYGIYGQRYSADGAPSGKEFQVNTYVYSSQWGSAVAALQDGGWVVVWHSYTQDGSRYGVYAQRYTQEGSVKGDEFRVNTCTYDDQISPAVAALLDGGWVVVWASNRQDGSEFGIYAQRYNMEGVASGSEVQVNTYQYSYQGNPVITALLDGGWVVVWVSQGQDGSGYGVYGQRYFSSGEKAALRDPIIIGRCAVSCQIEALSQQVPAQALFFSTGEWLWVWEVFNVSIEKGPDLLEYSAFFTVSHKDNNYSIETNATTALPCFENVKRQCVQPWQVLALTSGPIVLIWGDGFCHAGNTTLYAAVFGYEGLNPIMEPLELQRQLSVGFNYVAEAIENNEFLLAWSRQDNLEITVVRYRYNSHNLTEAGSWLIPLSIRGAPITAGLLTDLQMLVSPNKTLHIFASVKNSQTDNFDGWGISLEYDVEAQTWISGGLNGSLLLMSQAPNTEEIGLQFSKDDYRGVYWGVWQSDSSSDCLNDIYISQYQFQDFQFVLLMDPFRLNEGVEGQQYHPQVITSLPTGRVLVVWISQSNVAIQKDMVIYYQLLEADMTPLLLSSPDTGNCRLAGSFATCGFLTGTLNIVTNRDGGFLISWLGDQFCNGQLALYANRLDEEGHLTSFKQTFQFTVLDLAIETQEVTYTEDESFYFPARLIEVYSPAGNITIQLLFSSPNVAGQVVNGYTDPPQLNLTRSVSGKWSIQGHFYHVNQAWDRLYFTPLPDFNGNSETVQFQVADADGTQSQGWQLLPISIRGKAINDPPRAIFGQIPTQATRLDEDINLDLTTLIYDVDNDSGDLRFQLAECFVPNDTVISCDEEIAQLRAENTQTLIPCPWLTLQDHWLTGQAPSIGDWCVAIEASDGQANATWGVPFEVDEALPHLPATNSLFLILEASLGSGGGLLFLLLSAYYGRRWYRADTLQTRAYKDQLIHQEEDHAVENLRSLCFDHIVAVAKARWGEAYLFYIGEGLSAHPNHYQPTIYLSIADMDQEGRMWAKSFLTPHLSDLGFKVYFEEEQDGTFSPEERVVQDATYVLVIPSMYYEAWYDQAFSERLLIEAALGRTREHGHREHNHMVSDSSAVIVVFRPGVDPAEIRLPEKLRKTEEEDDRHAGLGPLFTPEKASDNMTVLFSFMECLAPQMHVRIRNECKRLENAVIRINRWSYQEIKQVMRGSKPAQPKSASAFFNRQSSLVEEEREDAPLTSSLLLPEYRP